MIDILRRVGWWAGRKGKRKKNRLKPGEGEGR